jgi:DNA invertase Pin-like site-specific DNA recombinase
VSSEHQRDGTSLDSQLQGCRQYVAQQRFMLHQEYMDVMSGKRDDRPAYTEMLRDVREMAKQGKRLAVIVWRLDRLGRRLLESAMRREELQKLGVDVHAVTSGGAINDLNANILSAVAQEESKRIGERVSEAIEHIRAGGWHRVAKLPYGYLSRPRTDAEKEAGAPKAVFDIHPEQAPIVREAFERLAGGASIRAVALWLHEVAPKDKNKHGWSRRAVTFMLNNPSYIGRRDPDEDGVDPLSLPVGRWPAIISDDLWRRVQAELDVASQLPKRAATRTLLATLLRCPREGCEGRMTGQDKAFRPGCKRAVRRYRCDSHRPDHRCTTSLTAPGIERDALLQVARLLDISGLGVDLTRELRREWDALRGAGTKGAEQRATERRIRECRAIQERGKKRLGEALLMMLDDKADRIAYDAAKAQIVAEMEVAGAELQRLEAAAKAPTLPPLDAVLARVGSWRVALEVNDIEGQRRVLVEFISHIYPVRVRYGEYAANITWTEQGEALRHLTTILEAAA